MQEPFGNAVHACTKVNLRGKRVAIVGCGTIGLFAVAIARAMGASYDHRRRADGEPRRDGPQPRRRRRARARSRQAAATTRTTRSWPKRIRKLTDGVGVDVALEMTGINSSVNNAIHCVRRGGDVILFGLKSGDAVIENFDRVIVDGIACTA